MLVFLDQPSLDGSFQVEAPPSPPPQLPDGSFNFQADGSFEVPDRNLEDTIGDVSVEDNLPVDEGSETTFKLIDEGTKRGRSKLADSDGYSYTVKKKPYAVCWTCSRRQRGNKCPATVVEGNGVYWWGGHRYTHPPIMHAATNLQIQASVRMANKRRQALRPKDPEFDLQEEHIPAASSVLTSAKTGRHLVFATDHQLKLLARAKTWYMDATFKVVGKPFYELFGIHAFVREDDTEKQVLLAMVFMSNKDKKDYKKVLKNILRLLPGEPKVTTLVMDFERGCDRRCGQSCRGRQGDGLQEAYRRREGVYRLLRNFMGLPMIPHEHVRSTFDALCQDAANAHDERLDRLRLKQKANRLHLPLYLLVRLLKREADVVTLQVQQVSFKKLKRYQRARYASVQGKGVAWSSWVRLLVEFNQAIQTTVPDVDNTTKHQHFYRVQLNGQTIYSLEYGREKKRNSRTVEFNMRMMVEPQPISKITKRKIRLKKKHKKPDTCALRPAGRATQAVVPLFFLCVRTNVSYAVVGCFIVQKEETEDIQEALDVFKHLEWIHNSEVEPREELDVVESLVGKKRMKGQIHCQIKWQSYPPEFNTWEPYKNLVKWLGKSTIQEPAKNHTDQVVGAEAGMLTRYNGGYSWGDYASRSMILGAGMLCPLQP
ncbi:hypothetical protein Bbelb_048480 [Branchiostoma belcheri]|nr:hypothetical protein Bbelb_048480 [Branchiostoma belcheri]